MRILITGIDGFTGRHLESFFLAKGWEVFGTTFHPSSNPNHWECDIRDSQAIQTVLQETRPDYVIHLAAISYVAEKETTLFYEVNVLGTQNLLASLLALDLSPQKVILASSAVVYGNQSEAVLDESLCPQPVNHYGFSKLSMEHLAKTYFEQLNLLLVRPFNYTGVGQAEYFLIPKIVSHYQQHKPVIELGNLEVEREFNDISDVCEIYNQLLLNPDARQDVVNIASNRPISLLEVIQTLNELCGYEIEVKVNPDFVRPNEIPRLSGSIDKLSRWVHLREPTPLKETLQTMLAG